ncbi:MULTISPECIES: hypothetical protein [Streptomyces]|uniref:Uncharacterized protein n=1 Tax=Streptomyces bottropensis ATCC 25435 TaxID=1054862 RepID=M3D820_9ACTN|nr:MULTISPECIES: hypothetical protein [Streptomyces]EMF52387.1 hypothetical protein SBD_5463 [Streptomyces bottropensis ATCC 25435]MZD21505.1 hypothetical protein [Streptomyces sp. SID5476]
MTLALVVALALAGVGVFIAYRDPKLGGALGVGVAILGVLYVVWAMDPSVFPRDTPAPSTTWTPNQGPQDSPAGGPPTAPSSATASPTAR